MSTDDPEIAKISKVWGARVPFKRPKKISEDVDTSHVCSHALSWYEKKKQKKVGFVCTLQPTSPFRQASDIDRCVELAKATNADTVMSISLVQQHPMWCFELNRFNQQLYPVMDVKLTGDNLVSQKLPPYYYPNGAVYVTRRDLLVDVPPRIFGSKIHGHLMPTIRSFDLETELDFICASSVMATFGKDVGIHPIITWKVS